MQLFVPRAMYGRRLEPPAQVLHGAGQSTDAFAAYWQVAHAKPLLMMTYMSFKDDLARAFTHLHAELNRSPQATIWPQIGLYFNGGGLGEHEDGTYVAAVGEGHYDRAIEVFCDGLASLRRPALLRIGFEFNGPWNGYAPAAYVLAWRRIVDRIRERGLDKVATVWCYCPIAGPREGRSDHDWEYQHYYPGDAWVNWWGLDLFDPPMFSLSTTRQFLADAHQARFPVMIGEATPRWVGGVQAGELAWQTWYHPFFELIRREPGIKAFCYINWDWGQYAAFADWGDARIQAHPVILDRYNAELSQPWYQHAAAAPTHP